MLKRKNNEICKSLTNPEMFKLWADNSTKKSKLSHLRDTVLKIIKSYISGPGRTQNFLQPSYNFKE